MLIRQIKPEEITFAHTLTKFENWDTTRNELNELISLFPQGFLILELRGKPIGMISSINYGSFGFIGNLIVLKDYRHQGYGLKLMNKAIYKLESQNIKTIFLDAVPSAVPLYESLNFKPICRSLRLEVRMNTKSKLENKLVRKMIPKDLSNIYELDLKLFKGNRTNLISNRFTQNEDFCYVIDRFGIITGYLMALPKKDYLYVGPWIMEKNEPDPYSILKKLFLDNNNPSIRVGILESNIFTLKILKHFQINEYNFSIRMYRGKYIDQSNGLIAIAGPDRG